MYGKKSISQSLLDAVNSVTQADVQEGFKELMKAAKDAAGPQPNGGSGIKLGTRYGGGKQKDDEREKETERLEKKKMKKEDMEFKNRLIESLKGNQKKIDKNHNNKIDAQDFKILRAQKEEVELDEADETKGLTVDTLAGRKKAPKGFEKDNEHTSAKVPLKTEEMEHDDEKEDKALVKKLVKKSALKNEETLEERDEGKHNNGKTTGFNVVAAKAAKEYGSAAAGKRVAGFIRKKVLAKEDTVEEGIGSTLKKAVKKVGDVLGHGSDEDLKKDLQRKMGVPQTGKPSMAKQNEETALDEAEWNKQDAVKRLKDMHKREKDAEKADKKMMQDRKKMKNEDKRPESDTVPFVTDEPQSPKERARAALGKVRSEMKKGW